MDIQVDKYWISFDEWNKLKIFRHYKELMIWNLSPLVTHTKEEITKFNDWYNENYPDNYKLLNLETNGK